MPYDPTTTIGKVRLLIGDRNDTSPLFTDAEIAAFLDLNEQNVRFAAADALLAIAADKARLAKIVELGNYSTEEHALNDVRALANDLREAELSASLQVGEAQGTAEHLDTFRKPWIGESDIS